MITYNGNEMMLQNDMGNTLIQDSKTGHIMGLSEGFVPVGLKEHGGIMYIASVNKDGVGEIGTIPSPILILSPDSEIVSNTDKPLVHDTGPESKLTMLNNNKIGPGEKFLIGLNFNIPDLDKFVTWYNKPMLTHFIDDETIVRGVYNIKLYTIYNTNSVCLDKLTSKPQSYWYDDNGLKKQKTSKYWFIPNSDIADIDINQTYIDREFKTYPGNLPAGRLAIKVELENIDSFSLMKSIQTEGVNKGEATLAPRVTQDKETKEYILDFPGFDYQTSSARFVGKVEFCLYDQKTKKELYNRNHTWENGLIVDESSTTVVRDPETFETHYQIRKSAKPIIPQKPLFSYNIGKGINSLNNWYQIVVHYYDQFGGKIDTYKYSFNPYHVLNFEEYYQLKWTEGVTYNQYYNINGSGNLCVYTDKYQLPPSCSMSIKTYLGDRKFEPNSNNPYIQVDVNAGPEGGNPSFDPNNYFPVASLNTSGLTFNDSTSNPIEFSFPSLTNLNYLYNRNTFEFKPIDENLWTVTWEIDNGIFLDEYCYPNFYINVFGKPIWGSENSSLYNGRPLLTAEGNPTPDQYFYDVKSTFSTPSIYLDNNYDGDKKSLLSDLKLVNNMELYDGNTEYDSRGEYQKSAIYYFTISATLKPNNKNLQWDLTLPNISDYTINPCFSLCGDSDIQFNIPMGLDRNGRPQAAWAFGESVLTPVNYIRSGNNSSFSSVVEYLPENQKEFDQIIYPGTYLLNLNAYSQRGKLSIVLNDEKPIEIEISDYYFPPQLIYVSKDTKLTISWSNIQRIRNIGLYQLSKPVRTAEKTIFGADQDYAVVYYQDQSLDVTSEVIIPIQATYYEQASCHDIPYNYYLGPSEACMTDRHKLANGDTLNFIFKWDQNNPKTAQVNAIPDYPEELKTLNYRQ